jgi:anthranilate synthase component I
VNAAESAHGRTRGGLGLAPGLEEPGARTRVTTASAERDREPRTGVRGRFVFAEGSHQMERELRIRPARGEFEELARSWPLVPVWAELLADVSTPVGLFESLASGGPGILLESVERSERWGRYSFVAGDPAALVIADPAGVRIEDRSSRLPIAPPRAVAPREALKEVASAMRAPRMPGLPPLAGGLMGVLAYEAAQLLDGHPAPAGGAPCPPITLQVIDRAVVFDHWRQRLLLVAHVPDGSYQAAVDALGDLATRVATAVPPPPEAIGEEAELPNDGRANMPDERFIEIVRDFKEHIRAGDIFQGVPSRRVTYPAPAGGLPIYRTLRLSNPAPYMFFVRTPGMELAGSSPEPLVRVEGRRVITRPIAGTYARGPTEERDRELERELLADPKERAEHAMLVDLARNDIGRVCVPGSVAPTELMLVERFSRVMHIVSTVEGDLAGGLGPLDALAVTFPAGTVTGAPKRRAMELIAAAEPTARGPYAGAVGYLTFAGDLDFCITIRTAVVADGLAHIQTGCGVVADSDPEAELRETKAKASALLPAVALGNAAPPSPSRDPALQPARTPR